MIENDYWAFACGDSTPDRDTILKQYTNASPKLYDSTAFGADTGVGSMTQANRHLAHWTPGCGDLTNYWPNPYPLPFAQMKDSTANYTIAQIPLWVDTSGGAMGHWGLGWWVKLLKDSIGPTVFANSVYRTPRHNKNVGSTALGSSHMRGVAVDMKNQGGQYDTVHWRTMGRLAKQAQASYIEPIDLKCRVTCLHADWRWWVDWPH